MQDGKPQILPHDLATEQALLAGILVKSSALDDVCLDFQDFYDLRHQKIFMAMLALYRRHELIDVITLAAELTQAGQLETAGGQDYLFVLAGSAGTSAGVIHYVKIVSDLSQRRQFILRCLQASDQAHKMSSDFAEIKANFRSDSVLKDREGQEQKNRRFHFLSAGDLCETPQPTKWLIKPFIDAESFSMIFGEPGCGKTFLALDQSLCIATGLNWHGHAVQQKGPVFYIAGEGFGGLNRRIKAWSIKNDIDLKSIPFFLSDRSTQFLAAEGIGEVVESIDKICLLNENPALVVIDTLNRNFGPGDENSTEDMTKFISIIDEVLRSRYHCAVHLVHHNGLVATERARGASALRAALDWEYRLQKKANGCRILSCTKSKDHEPAPTVCFIPETISLNGWINPDDGEAMTSCILRRVEGPPEDARALSGARKIAFDVLVNLGSDRVLIDTWRDATYLAGISPASSHDAKRKAFKRAVNELCEAGLVEGKDDFWRVADIGQTPDNVQACPDNGQCPDLSGQCPGT